MLQTQVWSCFTAHATFGYIDVLSEFIKSCKQSLPRAVRARPVDVNASDSARVRRTGGGAVFETEESALDDSEGLSLIPVGPVSLMLQKHIVSSYLKDVPAR